MYTSSIFKSMFLAVLLSIPGISLASIPLFECDPGTASNAFVKMEHNQNVCQPSCHYQNNCSVSYTLHGDNVSEVGASWYTDKANGKRVNEDAINNSGQGIEGDKMTFTKN